MYFVSTSHSNNYSIFNFLITL